MTIIILSSSVKFLTLESLLAMAQISTSEMSLPTEENIGLISKELTTMKQLKEFCKTTYQVRRLINKGVILILYLSDECVLFVYAKHGDKLRLLVLGLSLQLARWLLG